MPDPRMEPAAASASVRFLTFWLDTRRYALPAGGVAEVMRVPALTCVPQSPKALLGIANLRGAVLPVVSLRALLGMPEGIARATTRAVVLNVGAPVALVVDAVDALVTLAPERVETRHSELAAQPGEALEGAFQEAADKTPAKILDIKRLLDGAFAERARSRRPLALAGGAHRVETAASNVEAAEMLVTFDVAGQEFALDMAAVQEVLPAPATRTAIPRAEVLVLGVTSLRGALLPLLSLRALLGFPVSALSDAREKVIVMKVAGAQVGLVADRARAIVSAPPSLVDPVPPVLASRMDGESRIRAIYRGDAGRRLISILAPEQLFREDVMQRLAAHRDPQESGTREAAKVKEDTLDFLVFRLGQDEFALSIDAVEEVAQVPAKLTKVPKTPKFLEGVVNLRGTVLPVIDQRRRFDMPKIESSRARRLVVVKSQQHRAGLIVDSVSDVLRVPARSVEAAPDLTEDIGRLVRGVINLHASNRILLLLDPSELLTRAERAVLDKFQAETASASA
jgi:purine-binding chemotaxis protein CheW